MARGRKGRRIDRGAGTTRAWSGAAAGVAACEAGEDSMGVGGTACRTGREPVDSGKRAVGVYSID